MNHAAFLPAFAEIVAAALLLIGSAATLIGSLGLVRLRKFYDRVHAPTLGTTLGTASIATASMIHFTALASRPVVHEILIVSFVAVTTPISLMILVSAARLRDRSGNSENEGQSRNG